MDLRQQFRELHRKPFVIPNPWDSRLRATVRVAGLRGARHHEQRLCRRRWAAATRWARDARRGARARRRDRAGDTAARERRPRGRASATRPRRWPRRSRSRARRRSRAARSRTGAAATSPRLYPRELAVDRIRAAVESARRDASPLVLTARCENHIRGNPDLADTIARLPGLSGGRRRRALRAGPARPRRDPQPGRRRSIDPVNALILPGGPSVPELFEAGATRVSVGSAIAMAAQAAAVEAARELKNQGTHTFWTRALASLKEIHGGAGVKPPKIAESRTPDPSMRPGRRASMRRTGLAAVVASLVLARVSRRRSDERLLPHLG